jgi:sugar phosphate isomerase/epimerase
MRSKLSFFGFTKDIEAIAAAGYDCIEMHMREIIALEDPELKTVAQKLKDSSLVCEVLDNPIPLDVVIADESFNFDFYCDFLKKGADRAAEIGIKYYVFGNGRTRSLPESGDIEAAKEKNLSFMRMLADIAAEKGITVLIEPLAPTVSNVIHSIPEAIEYARVVGKPNVGTFLDYRWFIDRQHPFKVIEDYGHYIQHIHIDNPLTPFPRRVIPRLDDGHDYSGFFKTLKKIDYNGIISIEANTFTDFTQDLKDGLNFFKSYGIDTKN